jgi:hypothetical protein
MGSVEDHLGPPSEKFQRQPGSGSRSYKLPAPRRGRRRGVLVAASTRPGVFLSITVGLHEWGPGGRESFSAND